METLRTFVALVLPDDARHTLKQVQQDMAGRVSGIRWANPRAIHVTLAFLGSTPAGDLETISSVVEETASRCRPVTFSLQGIGAFPGERSPKVVWAGMRNCPGLFDLQRTLADSLDRLGFYRDTKPFRAHITLGRVRDGRQRRAVRALLDAQLPFGEFTADRLAFIHSDLQPTGPVYTTVHESRLQQN